MLFKEKRRDGNSGGEPGNSGGFLCVTPGWQSYQRELQRQRSRRKRKKSMPRALFLIPAIAVVFYGLYEAAGRLPDAFDSRDRAVVDQTVQEEKSLADKQAVRSLLKGMSFLNLDKQRLTVAAERETWLVDTSLDMELQKYLLEIMDTRYARQIGMVAMDPESGKVLAMVGHDKEDGTNNPCIDARFPAASVFKVVTAAGAIEKCGMGKDSPLVYNGRKYTLYKSQLKDKDNKYTRHVSLEKSFAESINPVFGKLGAHKLKKESLESYGRAFGFNRNVEFELPLEPSNLVVSDTPYNWAEIASGFNRVTTISPMHGALIVSTVLNGGMIPEPSIVEKITGENGKTLYQYRAAVVQEAVGKKTSAILEELMKATVASGTSRKIFRGCSRDRVLSRLSIGGKNGFHRRPEPRGSHRLVRRVRQRPENEKADRHFRRGGPSGLYRGPRGPICEKGVRALFSKIFRSGR